MKPFDFKLSLLLLLLSTLFALYIFFPYLKPGYNVAGDDCVHISYCQELRNIVVQKHKLFGWSYLYGVGAPIFIFRPPGFYLAAVSLYLLGGGGIPLLLAHKLITVGAMVLYPLAIYYMLFKFDFPPLAAGIASLLALAPISTWGHTIDAYFDLGLAKQTLAILLFPVALGKLHGIIRKGEAVFPGALVFSFIFLNHPYMALSLALCTGVYLTVHLVTFPLATTVKAIGRASSVYLMGGLLLAFWLLPFYSSGEIHPTKSYGAGWRHGFTVTTGTTSEVLEHFFRGSLFDNARGSVFGKGSVWAWRDNTTTGRWPALTYGGLIGLLVLMIGSNYFKNLFLLVSFLFSLLVFLGPDDVPWLRLIPFQEQFQYSHWIPIPELFCIAAAGVGIFSVIEIVALLLGKAAGLVSAREKLSASKRAIRGLAAAIILVVFIFPVFQDRYIWAGRKVKTRNFHTREKEQTPWSLRYPLNRSYQECTDVLRTSLPYERFYASPTSVQSGLEIFYFTVTPSLVERTDVISPLFAGLTGGWNRLLGSTFRRDLWKNENLVHLLNIRYLLSHQNNLEYFQPRPDFFEEAVSNRYWFMWKAIGESSSFDFTAQKPVLCFLDYREWEEINQYWPRYYGELSDPDGACHLVKSPSAEPRKLSGFNLPTYRAILLGNSAGALPPESAEIIRRFMEGGGEVYGLSPLPELPGMILLQTLKDFEFPPPAVPPPERKVDIQPLEERREYHSARVKTDTAGWLFFKMAYYRGWKTYLDGEKANNYCFSPGYNSVFISPGEHEVEFIYGGANNAGWGNLISLSTFLTGVGGCLISRRRKRRPREENPARKPPEKSGPAFPDPGSTGAKKATSP